MEINFTTPALLFPTVSLLMLAYTNRFLTLATIIRNLHDRYKSENDNNILGQIANLRYRIYLIRDMQIFGLAQPAVLCDQHVCPFCRLGRGWTVELRHRPDSDDRLDGDFPARVANLRRRIGFAAG